MNGIVAVMIAVRPVIKKSSLSKAILSNLNLVGLRSVGTWYLAIYWRVSHEEKIYRLV